MHFPRILSSCCVILLLFTGYSCRNTSATKQVGEKVNIKYAEGFDITRYPDYIRVDLRDPWDTTRLLHRYLLVDKKKGFIAKSSRRDTDTNPGRSYGRLLFGARQYAR